MSDTQAASDQARGQNRRWLRISLISAGAFVLFLVAGALAQRWVQPDPDAQTETVATEWTATISRLGLEPIYPPQEDITVGDIYLVISGDASTSKTLLGQGLKLWHVDLSERLKETYKHTFLFPDTLPKPKSDGEIWPQQGAKNSIFDTGAERQSLPLVMLPGFTIARLRQAEVTGGWISKSLQALGVIQAEGERTVELKIPFAETYGVPAIVANGYLVSFCDDPRFHNVCTEEGARGFLSTIVGDKAFEKIPSPEQGKEKYRLNVEILIVSGVYLTRSIETVTYTGNGFGAQTKLAVALNEELKHLESDGASANPPSQGAPEAPETAALRKSLEDHKSRLKAAIAQATGSPSGANVSVQSIDSNRIGVTLLLQRPVAIAFRSIRTALSEK